MVLPQPSQLIEGGAHPPAVGMDQRLVEQERRWLGIAADDARQRHPLQKVDQRSGAQAQVVDIFEDPLILGLDLEREIFANPDVPVAAVGDRRQLPLELRLEPRDHGPAHGLGRGFQRLDGEVVRMRVRLQVLELFADGRDLFVKGGHIADLSQPVVEQLFGSSAFLLGPLLGTAVLIALAFQLGEWQGRELSDPSGIDVAADLAELPAQVVGQLAERGRFVGLTGAALRFQLGQPGR